MIKRGVSVLLVAAVGVLSACAESEDVSAPGSATVTATQAETETAIPSDDAAALLERARDSLFGEPRGHFEQTTQFGSEDAGMTITSEVSYDISKRAWRMRQSSRQATQEAVVANFVIWPDAFYLTMEGWPRKWRGRWLRFSPDDLQRAASEGGLGSLSLDASAAAEPPVIRALRTARALSLGDAEGLKYVNVDLQAGETLLLANLGSGMRKENIDPDDVKGTVPARLYVDDDGGLVGLITDDRGFENIEGLPIQLEQVLPFVMVSVDFLADGTYDAPTVPAEGEILDPDEMTSR